ncbi:hypothetical protein JY96_15565 [Aquabacterium sp. NJ1]|nr:hypothetical protein JY96_15565 [Aquabacterium sp. NJ1]
MPCVWGKVEIGRWESFDANPIELGGFAFSTEANNRCLMAVFDQGFRQKAHGLFRATHFMGRIEAVDVGDLHAWPALPG